MSRDINIEGDRGDVITCPLSLRGGGLCKEEGPSEVPGWGVFTLGKMNYITNLPRCHGFGREKFGDLSCH